MRTISFGRGVVASFAVGSLVLALVGCSDDEKSSDGGGGGGGDACGKLCTDAKFSGGKETDYGGGVTECVCTGTSSAGGIAKAACEAHCAPKGVAAEKSFLSENASPNDKCVCDGT